MDEKQEDKTKTDFEVMAETIAKVIFFIVAAILAIRGIKGWGWFLFIACLV